MMSLHRLKGALTHGQTWALVRAAEIRADAPLAPFLSDHFGLTRNEVGVFRAIASGQTVADIATASGRTADTVRKHVKAILRKTGVGSQRDIILLGYGIARIARAIARGGGADGDEHGGGLLLPDGRYMPFHQLGADRGRPCLFLHGMLGGCHLRPPAVAELEHRGITLIAPERPGFGNASADADVRDAPRRLARDLGQLLDHLGIEACPVLGHLAGQLYGFATAAELGSRVSGMLGVAGAVPMVDRRQIEAMSPRQRLVAKTARYTPALLPFVVLAGAAMIAGGGERAFMEALYDEGTLDRALCDSDPEIFAILRDGYQFSVAQGHAAFCRDSYHVVRDWTPFVAATRVPVTILHGRHDPAVDIAGVRAFADRHDHVTLKELPDRGQLILYQD